jgi:hypothetical protein
VVGFGASNTSALTSGGYTGPTGPFFINTETWNGTSWTEVNDLNTGRGDGASFGLTSAGIAAGGFYGPPPVVAGLVESWDGTSWSEVNDLNTARYYARGIGISTSGLVVGGTLPGFSALNESWDGTSWTEVGDLNTARERAGGSGISTSGLIFGGNTPPVSALTEFYDGTSWTEVNDLSTARLGQGGTPSGTSSLALSVGGYTTTNVAVTEEWTAPSVFQQENLGQVFYNSTSNAFKVTQQPVPGGTWSSGGNLNTARRIKYFRHSCWRLFYKYTTYYNC